MPRSSATRRVGSATESQRPSFRWSSSFVFCAYLERLAAPPQLEKSPAARFECSTTLAYSAEYRQHEEYGTVQCIRSTA